MIKLGKVYDTSWVGFNLLVWTVVELQLGIICACAPSLRAFFRRYLSTMFSRPSLNGGGQSKSRSRSNGTHNHHPIDSHHNDSHQSKNRDLFDKTDCIDMQNLTKYSLDDDAAGAGPNEPPATDHRSQSQSQSHSNSKAFEAYNATEPVRWNSNSTLGVHVVPDQTTGEATRWYSNSSNGENQRAAAVASTEPLRQEDGNPREGGGWPLSPDSEVSGGFLRAQSVRSAV